MSLPPRHVAVVGGPRSGKSTLLRSIVTSMALVTTPLESQFFVLDFGGGTFSPLARLPHVSGVATRSEPDVVRRVMAEVEGIVDRREAYFRENGIDSIETYRSRRGQGRADDGWGDLTGLDLPPGVVVEGGAVVLPLRRDGRAPAPDWKDRALCAETDPEAFFPEKGGSTREAKRICSGCEVRAECLEYALANDERFGIWGGLSERERRRLRRAAV